MEIARQEMLRLRARSDEEESRWRSREQELIARLEDGRGRERKLEDQKHNLEVCLADATQQIQELKVIEESPFAKCNLNFLFFAKNDLLTGTAGRHGRTSESSRSATAATGGS